MKIRRKRPLGLHDPPLRRSPGRNHAFTRTESSLAPPSTTAHMSGYSNSPRPWSLISSHTASAFGTAGIPPIVVADAAIMRSWPENLAMTGAFA